MDFNRSVEGTTKKPGDGKPARYAEESQKMQRREKNASASKIPLRETRAAKSLTEERRYSTLTKRERGDAISPTVYRGSKTSDGPTKLKKSTVNKSRFKQSNQQSKQQERSISTISHAVSNSTATSTDSKGSLISSNSPAKGSLISSNSPAKDNCWLKNKSGNLSTTFPKFTSRPESPKRVTAISKKLSGKDAGNVKKDGGTGSTDCSEMGEIDTKQGDGEKNNAKIETKKAETTETPPKENPPKTASSGGQTYRVESATSADKKDMLPSMTRKPELYQSNKTSSDSIHPQKSQEKTILEEKPKEAESPSSSQSKFRSNLSFLSLKREPLVRNFPNPNEARSPSSPGPMFTPKKTQPIFKLAEIPFIPFKNSLAKPNNDTHMNTSLADARAQILQSSLAKNITAPNFKGPEDKTTGTVKTTDDKIASKPRAASLETDRKARKQFSKDNLSLIQNGQSNMGGGFGFVPQPKKRSKLTETDTSNVKDEADKDNDTAEKPSPSKASSKVNVFNVSESVDQATAKVSKDFKDASDYEQIAKQFFLKGVQEQFKHLINAGKSVKIMDELCESLAGEVFEMSEKLLQEKQLTATVKTPKSSQVATPALSQTNAGKKNESSQESSESPSSEAKNCGGDHDEKENSESQTETDKRNTGSTHTEQSDKQATENKVENHMMGSCGNGEGQAVRPELHSVGNIQSTPITPGLSPGDKRGGIITYLWNKARRSNVGNGSNSNAPSYYIGEQNGTQNNEADGDRNAGNNSWGISRFLKTGSKAGGSNQKQGESATASPWKRNTSDWKPRSVFDVPAEKDGQSGSFWSSGKSTKDFLKSSQAKREPPINREGGYNNEASKYTAAAGRNGTNQEGANEAPGVNPQTAVGTQLFQNYVNAYRVALGTKNEAAMQAIGASKDPRQEPYSSNPTSDYSQAAANTDPGPSFQKAEANPIYGKFTWNSWNGSGGQETMGEKDHANGGYNDLKTAELADNSANELIRQTKAFENLMHGKMKKESWLTSDEELSETVLDISSENVTLKQEHSYGGEGRRRNKAFRNRFSSITSTAASLHTPSSGHLKTGEESGSQSFAKKNQSTSLQAPASSYFKTAEEEEASPLASIRKKPLSSMHAPASSYFKRGDEEGPQPVASTKIIPLPSLQSPAGSFLKRSEEEGGTIKASTWKAQLAALHAESAGIKEVEDASENPPKMYQPMSESKKRFPSRPVSRSEVRKISGYQSTVESNKKASNSDVSRVVTGIASGDTTTWRTPAPSTTQGEESDANFMGFLQRNKLDFKQLQSEMQKRGFNMEPKNPSPNTSTENSKWFFALLSSLEALGVSREEVHTLLHGDNLRIYGCKMEDLACAMFSELLLAFDKCCFDHNIEKCFMRYFGDRIEKKHHFNASQIRHFVQIEKFKIFRSMVAMKMPPFVQLYTELRQFLLCRHCLSYCFLGDDESVYINSDDVDDAVEASTRRLFDEIRSCAQRKFLPPITRTIGISATSTADGAGTNGTPAPPERAGLDRSFSLS